MAKYNVGVGDAFPADGAERPVDDGPGRTYEDDDRYYWRRYYRYRRHHNFFFRISFMLLLIWGVLSIINHMAPHGLLVAAAITFALGVAGWIFRSDRDWAERKAARRAWRDERNRSRWEDR